MTAGPALGLYIHWPYCERICPYCDFFVRRDRGPTREQAALEAALLADIAAQADVTAGRRLVSIHFGGGTPSRMPPALAGELIAEARSVWRAAPDLEVTLEANPTDAEAARFAAFAAAGVNRVSLGVQSLDDAALRLLGRNHDAAAARRALARAAEAFPRVSIDLIYALPGQEEDAWRAELGEAASLGTEHISAYQLTIEEGTAFAEAQRRGALKPPSDEAAAILYETTRAVLADAGFAAYEISNHARSPAARSRHNLLYWTGGDYVGIGPGAHGRLTLAGERWECAAPRDVGRYLAEAGPRADARRWRLSPREAALERLLMGLRLAEGVPLVELAPLAIDPAVLAGLEAAGLVCAAAGRLRVLPAGRLVLDRITGELAAAG